jgi:Na+-driven multidrug efflux pump
MQLLIFILTTFGMTAILTQESIFKWLRKLLPFKPFTCSACMSVWCGFILSFIFPIIPIWYFNIFVCGMISYTSVRLIMILCNKNEFRVDD